MLIRHDDGTFTAGPLDVLCILHYVEAGTYHAAFFEERPPPGPPEPDFRKLKIVRLRSKMHHTTGAPDLDGANTHLDELATKIKVPDENLWRDPIEWDGTQGIVLVRDNWRREPERISI